MYKRLSQTKQDLDKLYSKGLQKGYSIGWDWDLLPMTIKRGSTSYFAAPPHAGKTEFWLEILINLSCLHGLKHLIFSPETGDSAEIYAELCSKFAGENYYGFNKMKESTRVYAEAFIDEHFVVIDPQEKDLSIEQFYKLADDIENELGVTFDTTTIDPMNELKEDFKPEDLGREDKYLSRILGYCRKNAKQKNRHNCLITHVRDQPIKEEEGIRYSPMPTAREIAGGQVWFRKGMLMGLVWRPPYGLADNNLKPYKQNQTVIKIAKSKPKGVSKNGVYNMYYNIETKAFYVEDERGNHIYADRGEYSNINNAKQPKQQSIESSIKPNLDFDTTLSDSKSVNTSQQYKDIEEQKKEPQKALKQVNPKQYNNRDNSEDFLTFSENWD